MKLLPNINNGEQLSYHTAYQTWAVGFKLKVNLSIKQWIGQAGYEAGKLLRSLRDKAEQWWYFLDHPQVPPDNNLAERSLRMAVTKLLCQWWVSFYEAVCSNCRLIECGADIKATGALGNDVFPTSLGGSIPVGYISSFPVT